MECILNDYVYDIKSLGILILQHCNVPNLQLLKMLFQHLHNFHQLVTISMAYLSAEHWCLFISDFQNLLCHHGPGSFQETVKLLRTELPDMLHAPYTFVRLTFAARAPLSTVALIERPSHVNVGKQ